MRGMHDTSITDREISWNVIPAIVSTQKSKKHSEKEIAALAPLLLLYRSDQSAFSNITNLKF